MKPNERIAAQSPARRAILELLKWEGPQDAAEMARRLEVSPMAVRQHLYALEEQKLVTHEKDPRPLGRPAKLWKLTSAADAIFPNAHADLTLSLLRSVRDTFGESGMSRLIAARSKEQSDGYRAERRGSGSLRRRREALAKVRTREGYMAEVREDSEGTLLLIENHCPICAAAKTCTNLCAAELSVFSAVLGRDVR